MWTESSLLETLEMAYGTQAPAAKVALEIISNLKTLKSNRPSKSHRIPMILIETADMTPGTV
jgi:hypothetical protein